MLTKNAGIPVRRKATALMNHWRKEVILNQRVGTYRFIESLNLGTSNSLDSLSDALKFGMETTNMSSEKTLLIQNELFEYAESLILNPEKGQREMYLEYLNEGHRRLILRNFKIIYKIVGNNIYITDFFDTRQDTSKMKG